MNPTKRMRLAALAAGGGGLLLLAGAMGAGAQDPPGDNATIKIDGVDFDDHPDNEPHVGCTFQVDFYNFDEDPDLFAHVVFTGKPPTGPEEVLLEDDVFVGEDPADGANEEGLDASETYDLTAALSGIEPHPQQGWHVRVDIDATDGTSKSKVFWVTGCEVPPTTSSSTTSTSTTSTSTTSTSSTSTSSTTVTTAPGSTTTTMAPGAPTTAGGGGVTPHKPAAPQAPPAAPGQLPRTGTSTLPLTVVGAALLAGGAGAGLLARRMAAGEGT